MANTLTNLIPTLYQALDIVSREITGFIPAVKVNASAEGAAVNEPILVPVTNQTQTYNITPGTTAPDNGDQTIDNVEIKITKSKMVPIRWNGEEQLGFSNNGTYNRVLSDQMAQAMRLLVNEVEADLAATYVDASRAYGTAGTAPFASALGDAAQARKMLVDNGAPLTDMQLVVDTLAGANLRSLTHLTHANEAGTDATLRRGVLLDLMGFAVRESAQVASHVAGSITGNMAVNNASGYAKGATDIAWDGATAASLKAGDLVKFGSDATFYVVGKDSTASPLTIAKPGLVKAVANDAAVALASGYTANLAFDRNAIQLVTRAPAMPQGGDFADDVMTITDPVSGISFQVAVYREYHRVKFEIGLAWGCKLIKPEHAVILLG
jgi:hypothetical protein